jgi:hypothetical protein
MIATRLRSWATSWWALTIVLGLILFEAQHLGILLHGYAPSGVTLTDIQRVDQLQQRFNADAGHPRLILILSPT